MSNKPIPVGSVTVVHLQADASYYTVQLETFYLHPRYETGQLPYYDVAVVVLQQPIVFNSKVFPACLHTENTVPEVGSQSIKAPSDRESVYRSAKCCLDCLTL